MKVSIPLLVASSNIIQGLNFNHLFSKNDNDYNLVYGYSTVVNNTIQVLLGKVIDKKNNEKVNSKLLTLNLEQKIDFTTDEGSRGILKKVNWKSDNLGYDFVPVYGPACVDNSTLKTICYGGNYLSESNSFNTINRYQIFDKSSLKFTNFAPKVQHGTKVNNVTNIGMAAKVGAQVGKLQNKLVYVGGLNSRNEGKHEEGIEVWVLDNDILNRIEYSSSAIKPKSRFYFSLTKVSQDSLLMVGGRNLDDVFGLNEIHLFNIKSLTWSTIKTNNSPKHGFHSHSATVWFNPVTKTNELIIYGGADKNDKPIKNNLYALDLVEYTFTKLALPNDGQLYNGRYGHLATLIDSSSLLIYFGNCETRTLATTLFDLLTLREIQYFKGLNGDKFNLEKFIESEQVFKTVRTYSSSFIFIVIILIFATLGYVAYKRFIDGNQQFLPIPTDDNEIDMEENGFGNEVNTYATSNYK